MVGEPGKVPVTGTVRAVAFYFVYVLTVAIWGGVVLVIGWALPYPARFAFGVGVWSRFALAWLRLTCGITWRISGVENIPERPCIVFSRHESSWETLILQSLFRPQATLIKRELLRIPLFGWSYAMMKPISIDRNSPGAALRKLISVGRARLAEGIWVVLFPEGTRMRPGEFRGFQAGGAALAAATGAPVVVVAHNAGDFWPAHRLRKRPGVIDMRISPPITTAGKSSKEINREASSVMSRMMGELARTERKGSEEK